VKILSAADIRAWDQFSIQHEPVASIELMERAAYECVRWILQQYPVAPSFAVFCGKGNNGGDGLAIARMLRGRNYPVSVYILEFGHKGTDDFQTNLAKLQQLPSPGIHFIQSENNFHPLQREQVVIDALFGSGLNRALEDVTAKLVEHINHSGADIVSIDIPSGLFTDRSSKGNMIVRANHTLSFQCYKPAFLVPENASYTGDIHILDIGLHPDFVKTLMSPFELIDISIIQSIYRPRNRFAHKGSFGHALLAAGSYGKIGAAVLSVRACLRSGVGLLTCHIPKCGYDIIQTAVPEAMAMTDFNSSFLTKIEEDITKYDAIGIGPGIGTASETRMLVREIFDAYRSPMVLDADALNCLSLQKDLLQLIPAGSILTPHPKEFERLFGKTANDFERQELALQKARELNVIIILKGHHTMIATTDGRAFFNSTGNAGMATGGSGDVLTGILTGLLAQGYSSIETAIFGTYLHGLAGDLAAEKLSMEAMAASDLIECLGEAFKKVAS
jgi:hydroxyethylthiazole kinase-like uncharacterized protein yjeF